MPIKGLSEQRRLPRLGKIHLGYKDPKKKGAPTATDYFVCPPEVQAIYGEQPQRLEVIIPVEDEEMWASQYYRQYSRTRGLVCKGDGVTCRRMVDTGTGGTANRDTKAVVWKEGLPCAGRECPDYKVKKCQEVMNLQFLLPRVPGLGIWQIDTGSINSIRNINSCAAMVRAVCDRVSWIPLSLTLEPTEVVNPEDGKKKIVRCLNLRHEQGLLELLTASGKGKAALLITAPVEDEAPLDSTNDKAVVKSDLKQAEQDTKELWPEEKITSQDGASDEQVFKASGKVEAKTEPAPPAKSSRDPATITNFGELYKACNQDFGMKTRAEVWKELGVNSQEDITETPAECFRRVAAVRQ